uniref:Tryptophan synthase beta chain-like PALP domain-containing protein n=1 Tax=Globisporangium ultimum (strain ATCC 200006 / CBS 805.95 / DAOM BR144) TaxID=431595 RepID=K3WZQ6_GLOUD
DAAALLRRRQQLQDELTKSSPVTRVRFRDQSVHVKRDDVFHLAGNKMRKLHWFVKQDDTFYKDAHLVSFGGAQSNAMLAIAQLAQTRGVPFTYFSRGLQLRTDAFASNREEPSGAQQPSGNLVLALELGMQHVELSPAVYQQLAQTKDFSCTIEEHAHLQHLLDGKSIKNAVFIPQGAAFEHAHEGLEELAHEINAYVTSEQSKDKCFSVVVPAGTGTTALYMAQHLDPSRTRLFAVPCIGDATYLQKQFMDLVERDAVLTQRAEAHTLTLPSILTPNQKARFGRLSWPLYDMYHELVAATQVEFDLVYGCFAWQTMFTERSLTKLLHGDGSDQPEHELNPRELLYVHTGGVSGNATMLARYLAKKKQ